MSPIAIVYIDFAILLCTSFFVIESKQQKTECNANWVPHGHYCYQILNINKYRAENVSRGNELCKKHAHKESQLPIIKFHDDSGFYNTPQFKSKNKIAGNTYVLLGATWDKQEYDQNGQKIFRWNDDSKIPNKGDAGGGFQNWRHDQPQNTKEYELSLGFRSDTGKWHDFMPKQKDNYSMVICQVAANNANGRWGQWKNDGDCDKNCGGGKLQLIRKCDSPAPAKQRRGKDCVGNNRKTKDCNMKDCKTTTDNSNPGGMIKQSTTEINKNSTTLVITNKTETTASTNNIGLILGIVIPLLLLLLLLLFLCLFCLYRRKRKKKENPTEQIEEQKSAKNRKSVASATSTKSLNSSLSRENSPSPSENVTNTIPVLNKKSAQILGFDTALKKQVTSTDENTNIKKQKNVNKNKKTGTSKIKKNPKKIKASIGVQNSRASKLSTFKKRF